MVKFVVTTILTFSCFHVKKPMLTGNVCPSEYPKKGYRCCKDYYPVNNECVVCPPGFVGINCSDSCQPGYYGKQCLSVCNCLEREICQVSQGCLPLHDCKKENCTWESQRRPQFKNTAKISQRWRHVTSYDNTILAAVLGSITFILIVFSFLIKFNMRFNINRYSGALIRVLNMRRPQIPDTTSEQRQVEHGYVEDNPYADIRMSRELPNPDRECSQNSSNTSSNPRYQNENFQNGTNKILRAPPEYAHCDSEFSGLYNTLSFRAANLSEYSDTSTTERDPSIRTNECVRMCSPNLE